MVEENKKEGEEVVKKSNEFAEGVEKENEEAKKALEAAEARYQKLLIVRDPAVGRIVEVVNVQNCPHSTDAKQLCREAIEEYDLRKLVGLVANVMGNMKVNKRTGAIVSP